MFNTAPFDIKEHRDSFLKRFSYKYEDEQTRLKGAAPNKSFSLKSEDKQPQPEEVTPNGWRHTSPDFKGTGWLIDHISLMEVTEIDGTAITIGDGSLYTGRAKEGRFYKKLKTNGTPFLLSETDSCASLTYEEMAVMANTENFSDEMIAFFKKTVARDMLRVGFNGKMIAENTNPDQYKNGEDINIGWHALAKTFNKGSQVISDAFALGKGGDFADVHDLADCLITSKIPEGQREDPGLVVMVGAQLAARERLKLFNMADQPLTLTAGDMLESSVAGRFAFIPPFMPGKRLAVTTLKNLQILTLKHSQRYRAEIVANRGVYEHGYLREEGYALGDSYLYAASDENAVTLV
ncbi:P2 family phage major capsid protein [Salmonella enterica]|nr:P2 family phage major capsid protein [Salmonella enterica subsp. houtenae]EGO0678678.1 P2 family phage major capsid protein [Salmonella enterica]EGO0679177.1 P2 family phage major capsid protein [Salmonella enterica]EGO0733668.1 P2 family phage major capsid protein [Salmonella enterica]EGO0734470.1 P2 family phage major capsid protein [Salmonella enterica]